MKSMDSNNISGTLYIVATPIGNLGDITMRAISTLKEVDVIAAEDTRHTVKLLNHYDIKTRLISHHEHNAIESANGILMLLEKGNNVALVSDAGMPCISDPGYELVMMARNQGFSVTCLPGASAMPTAVALSGLDAARFRFEGFLPKNKAQRLNLLEEISKDGCAIVIYEAPHRLTKTLGELIEPFKGRKLAIINDITKLHERVETYNVDDVMNHLDDWNLKGEFVIVIEKGDRVKDDWWETLSIEQHIVALIEKENLSKMDAIKKVAKQRNVKKGDIYKQAIDI